MMVERSSFSVVCVTVAAVQVLSLVACVWGGGWQPLIGYTNYNVDALLDSSGAHGADCATPFGTDGTNPYIWTLGALGISTSSQLNSLSGTPYYFQNNSTLPSVWSLDSLSAKVLSPIGSLAAQRYYSLSILHSASESNTGGTNYAVIITYNDGSTEQFTVTAPQPSSSNPLTVAFGPFQALTQSTTCYQVKGASYTGAFYLHEVELVLQIQKPINGIQFSMSSTSIDALVFIWAVTTSLSGYNPYLNIQGWNSDIILEDWVGCSTCLAVDANQDAYFWMQQTTAEPMGLPTQTDAPVILNGQGPLSASYKLLPSNATVNGVLLTGVGQSITLSFTETNKRIDSIVALHSGIGTDVAYRLDVYFTDGSVESRDMTAQDWGNPIDATLRTIEGGRTSIHTTTPSYCNSLNPGYNFQTDFWLSEEEFQFSFYGTGTFKVVDQVVITHDDSYQYAALTVFGFSARSLPPLVTPSATPTATASMTPTASQDPSITAQASVSITLTSSMSPSIPTTTPTAKPLTCPTNQVICTDGSCKDSASDCKSNLKPLPNSKIETTSVTFDDSHKEDPTTVVLSDKASNQVLGSINIPPNTFKSGWTLVFTPAKKTKADKQHSKKSKGCDKGEGEKKKKKVANENLSPGFSVEAYDENGKRRDISDLPKNVDISLYATLPKNSDKDNICIGFASSEKEPWECLKDTKITPTKQKDVYLVTSSTSHFTSFSVLLFGSVDVSAGCGDGVGGSGLSKPLWIASTVLLGCAVAASILLGVLYVQVPAVQGFIKGFKGKSMEYISNKLSSMQSAHSSHGSQQL